VFEEAVPSLLDSVNNIDSSKLYKFTEKNEAHFLKTRGGAKQNYF